MTQLLPLSRSRQVKPQLTGIDAQRLLKLRSSYFRVAVAAVAAVALTACSSMSERESGTAKGAAIGAVAGAAIGAATKGSTGRSAAIGGLVGAVAGNLWTKHQEEKREALERASAGTGIEVTRTADNRIRVSVPADATFAVGQAALQPALRPVLDEIARAPESTAQVYIVGHTDASGSEMSNQTLSQQRADAVRNYLTDRGVPSSKVVAVGRGEMEPIASNDSAQGRSQNRRVEIYLSQTA